MRIHAHTTLTQAHAVSLCVCGPMRTPTQWAVAWGPACKAWGARGACGEASLVLTTRGLDGASGATPTAGRAPASGFKSKLQVNVFFDEANAPWNHEYTDLHPQSAFQVKSYILSLTLTNADTAETRAFCFWAKHPSILTLSDGEAPSNVTRQTASFFDTFEVAFNARMGIG